MSKLTVTARTGGEVTMEGQVGLSVTEAIRNPGSGEWLTLSGVRCSCATCHV